MMWTDFHFSDPNYLWLALLCLPLAFGAHYWAESARKRLLLFSGKSRDTAKDLERPHYIDRPTVCFFAAICFFALALARPQANPEIEEREGQALDIIVMLDVSKSMAAEDIYPNRLGQAKRAVNSLLTQLSGDRVGLVAYAGSAVLVSPLTSDYEILRSFLFGLSVDTIENQGTNIEAAMDSAMEAFKRGSEHEIGKEDKSHVLLLLSDGEMNAGELDGALKEAKKQGLIIYTITVGGDKGVPIPIRNKDGGLVSFKNDRRGNPVLTTPDPATLDKISSATGGKSYRSSVDGHEITELVGDLANLNRASTKNIKSRIYSEYFYVPLALGILFLFFAFIPRLKNFRLSRSAQRNIAFLIIFLFAQAMAQAQVASQNQPSENIATPAAQASSGTKTAAAAPAPEPGLNLVDKIGQFFSTEEKNRSQAGLDDYAKGRYSEAADEFKKLQVDHPNSPELAYSTATALLKQGKNQEGRNLLEQLEKNPSPSSPGMDSLAAFNAAGSYAEEKNFDKAIQGFASLVDRLGSKPKRSPLEERLLTEAEKRIEIMAKKQEEQKQQQQKDQKDQDKKDKKDDKKQEQGSDNKSKSDQSKSENQKSEEKDKQNQQGEQDKKQDEQKKQDQQKQYDFQHRKKFQENEVLSERDAKRILEALKQQEQLLQKKFLQQKTSTSRQPPGPNDKDW